MIKTTAAFTHSTDSAEAGRDLAAQIAGGLDGETADAVIVFASAVFDHAILLQTLHDTCRPQALVGASSAGEFTGARRGEGSACALAIRSSDIRFAVSSATGVRRDPVAAAEAVVAGFVGIRGDHPHRAALVLTDALAGHADDLVEALTVATSGRYQFAGGGAGDDARFARTVVFDGVRVLSDAVVALEVLSSRPVGIGVHHGWQRASEPLRVTEVDGARLVSLDGFPAIHAFEQHAAATGQRLDLADPLPFFLHNVLGVETPTGERLRVPLACDAQGAVVCAAEIPAGARVYLMRAGAASACDAAAAAARTAVEALGTSRPAAALFFDCVATRLRLGDMFSFELDAVRAALGTADLVGCNTYGQIARAPGQFSGFHNCTAVVLALPEST